MISIVNPLGIWMCSIVIQSCQYDWMGSLRTCPKCQKLVALTLLVWHLAAKGESLGDSDQTEATGIARRLAVTVVPPGDYY